MALDAEYEEVFENAAKLIETRGWRQGINRGMNSVCAAEAVSLSAPVTICTEALLELASRIGGKAVYDIIDWNDIDGRTKEQVLAALRNEPLEPAILL